MLKKSVLITAIIFSLITLIISSGSTVFAQSFQGSYAESCARDFYGNVSCPQYDLADNFCENGTVVSGGIDECGCALAPVCQQAPKPTDASEFIACTLEAKQCPDGSFVGRVGPNCEFAPCPSEASIPTPVPTNTPRRSEGITMPVTDLNQDGQVNLSDYNVLKSQFLKANQVEADLNGDGKVNLMDYTILVNSLHNFSYK